jgi:hypothetical protein
MTLSRRPATCFQGMAGVLGFRRIRKVLDGLADDLELANCGVLPHALSEKSIAASAGVDGDVIECVADVL